MPNITSLTLAQLRTSTAAQVRTAVATYLSGLSKRQLILFLMDTDRIPDDPIRTYRPDGQIATHTEVDRDTETGAMTGGRVLTHTYYAGGEIDTIIISTRDASNIEVSRKTIKHYADGRQPTASEQ